MILAMEGVEGVGKTTVSKKLVDGCGAVIYRAMRGSDGITVDQWRADGVPVNTFVEDMFAVDLLSKIKPDLVVLDRSLISGLAYDDSMWQGNAKVLDHLAQASALTNRGLRLLSWWARQMRLSDGFIAHLTGDPEYFLNELEKYDDRGITKDVITLHHDRINYCVAYCEELGVPVKRIDTSIEDVDDVVNIVCQMIERPFQLSMAL